MKLLQNRKGLSRLLPAVQIFIMAGLILGLGILVLVKMRGVVYGMSNEGNSSLAYKAINESMTALGDFGDWFPIIVIGIAAMILLGLVIGGLMRRRAT